MEYQEENNIKNKVSSKGKQKKNLLNDILNGNIFVRDIFLSHLGYLFFITFIGIFYIGNRYHAEKTVRNITRSTKELKDLRSISIATSSELLSWKNQSNVYLMVKKKNLGLKPLVKPPKKLYIDD